MTKDDIMRMGREAGLHSAVLLRIYDDKEAALCDSEIAELRKIERFASLVVANINPKSFMSWQEGYEAGVVAERAECAKLCNAIQAGNEDNGKWLWEARNCAAAIRARSGE